MKSSLSFRLAAHVAAGLVWKCSPWSPENFVFIPGAVYAGNRFDAQRRPYSPKIRDIGQRPGKLILDIPRLSDRPGLSHLDQTSLDAATPALGIRCAATQSALLLLDLIREIAHSLPQFVSRADRPIPTRITWGHPLPTLPEGWICERVNITPSWAEPLGEQAAYSQCRSGIYSLQVRQLRRSGFRPRAGAGGAGAPEHSLPQAAREGGLCGSRGRQSLAP